MLPPALTVVFSLIRKAFLTPCISLFLAPGMMKLPKPSGPHLVGTAAFRVEDQTRINQPFDSSARTFALYCWYPAYEPSSHTLPYLAHNARPLKQAFCRETKLSGKLIDAIFAVKTHSFVHALPKASVAPFPVIVLSHGLGGFGLLHCSLAENLASRGYFVVGIDHTNFSTVSVINDTPIWYDNVLHELFSADIPRAELFARSAELFQIPIGDITATINYLEQLNTDTNQPLYGQLDLSRLGLIGHSMGGIASLEVARRDSRCKAVVSLDGWFPTMNSTEPMGKPALILFSDKSQLHLIKGTDLVERFSSQELHDYYHLLATQAQTFVKNNGDDSQFLVVPNASHLAFCDFVLLKWPLTKVIPSRQAHWLGGQNPYPIIQIINSQVRAFFDWYVKC